MNPIKRKIDLNKCAKTCFRVEFFKNNDLDGSKIVPSLEVGLQIKSGMVHFCKQSQEAYIHCPLIGWKIKRLLFG